MLVLCTFLHLFFKKYTREIQFRIEGNLCNCFQNSTAFAVPCFAEITGHLDNLPSIFCATPVF